jgi:protein subunit release factor A
MSDTSIRMTHIPTGITLYSRDQHYRERSQWRCRQELLRRMRSFLWARQHGIVESSELVRELNKALMPRTVEPSGASYR